MSKVAQIELTNINEKYKNRHLPNTECKLDDNTKDEEISTIFHRSFMKVMSYSIMKERMKEISTSIKDDPLGTGKKIKSVTYQVNDLFDYLMSTDILGTLPEIQIQPKFKDKVRVRWSHNSSINLMVKGTFSFGGIILTEFDSGWCEDYIQWNSSPGFDKNIKKSLCNTEQYQTFGNYVKPGKFNYSLPYFYSYNLASSFPLFMISTQTPVTQTIDYIEDIAKHFLQIECLKKGKWEPHKVEKGFFINYPVLETPVLIGNYGHIADIEKKSNIGEGSFVIPIHNVTTLVSNIPISYGSSCDIPIEIDDETVAIFWKAVNLTSVSLNNYSNYTTDSTDFRKGESPIAMSTLSFKKQIRFNITPYETNSYVNQRNFTSIPENEGYNAYAFSSRPFDPTCMVGTVMDSKMGAILNVVMIDPNGEKKNNDQKDSLELEKMFEEDDEEEKTKSNEKDDTESVGPSNGIKNNKSDDLFRIEVRILTIKDLEFNLNNIEAVKIEII